MAEGRDGGDLRPKNIKAAVNVNEQRPEYGDDPVFRAGFFDRDFGCRLFLVRIVDNLHVLSDFFPDCLFH